MNKTIPIIFGVLLLAVILPSQAFAVETTDDIFLCSYPSEDNREIYSWSIGSPTPIIHTVFNVTGAITGYTGCTGMSQDPTDGTYYAVLRDGNGGGAPHDLVTFDIDTGLGVKVGTFGIGIGTMAFNSTGHLFAYENADSFGMQLFLIDKTDASTITTCVMGSGEGTSLGYDYTNEELYMWDAGNDLHKISDVNDPSCGVTTQSLTGGIAGDGGSLAWNTNAGLFYGQTSSPIANTQYSLNVTTAFGVTTNEPVGVPPFSNQLGMVFALSLVTDTTSPVISTTSQEPITVLLGDVVDELDFISCIDDIDGDITNSVVLGGAGLDTDVRGTQFIEYVCTDLASNVTEKTVNFIVKKKSTGGSSISSGGVLDSTPRLSDIPTLSVQDSPREQVQEGQSIADLFANLFDNRITEGITTPAPSVSSGSPAPSQTSNPVADFFQSLFSGFFN